MNLDYYFWIYGLAEALALSLVAAVVFGFKWWGLRRERHQMERVCQEVLGSLEEELEAARKDPMRRPELRDGRVACFHALSAPFQRGRFCEAEAWQDTLDILNRSFDELARSTLPSLPPEATPAAEAIESRPSGKGAGSDEEPEVGAGFACPELETEIDLLLTQHNRGVATLAASRGVAVDMKRKCEDIRLANQNLRVKLESVVKQDRSGQILQMLDEIELSNHDLQQMMFATERHHSNLGPQIDALGQQIRNLQLTVKNYRKSLQKLLLDRDALAEEKKEFVKQLEAKTKLVERLNRNYDALRREYTKLYEATR
jgi:DNA repair exonuclease SbcCD ATPase subunit